MDQLIGRHKELNTLRKYYNSDKAEFIAIYGRRRVGKTFLVDKCFDYKYDFYMSGVIEGSYTEELYTFNQALRQYGSTEPNAKNWFEAFEHLRLLLESHLDKKRILVFIDELPCLDTSRSRFVKAFDMFWNTWASKHSNIMMIVCGSATSWMIENIIDSHGGLHNRITHEMHILPFCLHETEEYLTKANFNWDRLTIAQCYMCMGGIPYYLSLLDNTLSLAQNLDNLYFAPDGPLRREYDRLFHALFRKPEKYLKIIECLSKSRSGVTRTDMIKDMNIKSGDNLTRMLKNLELCDFIRSYSTTSRASSVNGKAYQIIDFYVLFYLKFCKRTTTDQHWWSHNLGKNIQNEWFGIMFEILCVIHITQIKMALGIDGIYTEYAAWRSKTESKAQIDLLIDRADSIITICEMKYSKGEYALDKAEAQKLERRKEIYEAEVNPSKGIQIIIVTTRGLKPNAYSSIISRTITLSDLFALPRE